MSRSSDRIGVFDSGVGGLTVVGALLRRLPGARVLYVADQAHVPYGGRPLAEIRGFATEISRFLAQEGCGAILMACNISSAVALDSVRHSLAPLPVWGMISAAARRAVRDRGGKIGVLATEGTVRSGAYTAAIWALDPTARVTEVACPRFVPLVESGCLEGEPAGTAAAEYLAPIVEAECSTVVLGCTHYPFLLPALRRAAGPESRLAFIDPAEELIDAIAEYLHVAGAAIPADRLLLTTGEVATFESQIPRFLPGIPCTISPAVWSEGDRVKLRVARPVRGLA